MESHFADYIRPPTPDADPQAVLESRKSAIKSSIELLSKNKTKYFQELLSLLGPLWQNPAALRRRSATEFALALLKEHESSLQALADLSPQQFTSFVQAIVGQCSDWHSVATGLLDILVLLLCVEAPSIRVPQEPWLVSPKSESSNFRNRPIDDTRSLEDEVIDVSELASSLLTKTVVESTESFLIVPSDAEIPLSVLIVSGVFVFVFGANFTPSIRSSIYVLIETAIAKHSDDLAFFIGPRLVNEVMYQMIDETDNLPKCLSLITLLRFKAPHIFVGNASKSELSDLPTAPQSPGHVQEEWHHARLIESYLIAYLPLESGKTVTHVLTNPECLKIYAAAWHSWDVLLPKFFDHSLDLLASLVDRDELVTADRLAVLLALVARNTDPDILRHLMVPVVELAKLCLWSGSKSRFASIFGSLIRCCCSSICAPYASKLLDNEDYQVAFTAALNQPGNSDQRGEEVPIQFRRILTNLKNLLYRPSSASGTAPHDKSSEFKAAMSIMMSLAKSSLTPCVLAWEIFVPDMIMEARQDLSVAMARLTIISDLTERMWAFFGRYCDQGATNFIKSIGETLMSAPIIRAWRSVKAGVYEDTPPECRDFIQKIDRVFTAMETLESPENLHLLCAPAQVCAVCIRPELFTSSWLESIGLAVVLDEQWLPRPMVDALIGNLGDVHLALRACDLIASRVQSRRRKNFWPTLKETALNVVDLVIVMESAVEDTDINTKLTADEVEFVRKLMSKIEASDTQAQGKLKILLEKLLRGYPGSVDNLTVAVAQEVAKLGPSSLRCVPGSIATQVLSQAFDNTASFVRCLWSEQRSFNLSTFHMLASKGTTTAVDLEATLLEVLSQPLDDTEVLRALSLLLSFMNKTSCAEAEKLLVPSVHLKRLLMISALGIYSLQETRVPKIHFLPLDDTVGSFFNDVRDQAIVLFENVDSTDADMRRAIHVLRMSADNSQNDMKQRDGDMRQSDDPLATTLMLVSWHCSLKSEVIENLKAFIKWFHTHKFLTEFHRLVICGVMCNAVDQLAREVANFEEDRLEFLRTSIVPLLSKVANSLRLESKSRVVRSTASLFVAVVNTLFADVSGEIQQLERRIKSA